MATKQTVFITGGGSGIGMGLASAFHARGAKVIIGGRDLAKLETVAARHPGMDVITIDVTQPQSIAECFRALEARYPSLDTVINNAGIQNLIDFRADRATLDDMLDREIDTNLKGFMRVSSASLPVLLRQPHARLIHIGSGLAFVPLVAAPVYSATKAAVHSFSISLREQLKTTSVKVIEVIPPVVETDLHASLEVRPPNPMPLDRFIAATMAGFDADRPEIAVGLARALTIGSRIAPSFFLKIVNKYRKEKS